MASRSINIVSLCTGGAGLDLGIEMAMPSARTVCMVEREAFAVAHLVAAMQAGLLADCPVWSDARTLDGRRWRGCVDGVIGGIPCQPHSVAGRRRGSDDERDLWSAARRIVVQARPWFVLIENVAGMLTAPEGQVPGRCCVTAKKYRIDVSARMVNAALVCASTEETRYYLNGVHVEPHPEGGAVLVSTDGHRMLVVHDRDGVCRETGIIADNKELRRALGKIKDVDARLTVDRAGELIADSYRQAEKTLIDGTFPNWKAVLRPIFAAIRKKTVVHAAFNPRYLADFRVVGDRLSETKDEYRSIRVVAPTESGVALIRFARITYAFGVLMPMRQDIPDGVPAFMPAVMRKPAQKAAKPKLKAPARSK